MSIITNTVIEAHAVFLPPPDLRISEWAETEMRLSAEDSSEPGLLSFDRAGFQRGILDALNDSEVQEVVIMSSAQVGKTTILKAVIGYYIAHDPAPMLCVQPTVQMAEAFSKDRLAPMVRDTPCLSGKIADFKSRTSGNTVLHKRFPGGHITLAGSNSPASLASRPCRIILLDEVDRYPESAGSEGDPVNLAKKRATTFWNRKILQTSTPTVAGVSRIEQSYEASDKRRFYVPCAHCGEKQVLNWDAVKWPEGQPQKARLHCRHCGSEWSERERLAAISDGEWRGESEFNGVAGFHLSELYSPWSTPARMAIAYVEARESSTEQFKTWVNTALGETWEEEGDGVSDLALSSRAEQYPDTLPAGVITAGVDIQKNRIEATVALWAEGEEAWPLDHLIIPGDTARPEVYELAAEEMRAAGVDFAAVDSGYQATMVYEFAARHGWILQIKGVSGMDRPLIQDIRKRRQRMRSRNRGGTDPEIIGVDQGKALIHSRLRLEKPGPGYIHFPVDQAFDDEYFAQLAAEIMVKKKRGGRQVLEWVQVRSRNEALDCMVYALAAYRLAQRKPAKKTKSKKQATPQPEKQKNPKSFIPKTSNFIRGARR